MAKKKTSRAQVLQQAAELRAQIVALVNNAGVGVSRSQVQEQLQSAMDARGLAATSLNGALTTLSDNGLIRKERRGREMYYLPASKTRQSQPRNASSVRSKAAKPQFEIDIVKSTGQVRLTLQNIVILIGVVES